MPYNFDHWTGVAIWTSPDEHNATSAGKVGLLFSFCCIIFYYLFIAQSDILFAYILIKLRY